jgi:hypothetical protein
MKTKLRIFLALALLLLFAGWILLSPPSLPAAAQGNLQQIVIATPRGPDRYTSLKVTYNQHEWWLTQWIDNKVVCQIYTDEEGLPTRSDVFYDCGEEIFKKWVSTNACNSLNPADCGGFYLHHIGAKEVEREIPLVLPPPVVWIGLHACEPHPSNARWCADLPQLILTGIETLPNERIIRLEGRIGTEPFSCNNTAECSIPLKQTANTGQTVEFWAFSSYGDGSPVYTAQVRVLPMLDDMGETTGWDVTVLSTQWVGAPPASCAQGWETFPPPEGIPAWLSSPETHEELASNIPYAYLAGNLISQGAADVSACLDGGILPNGAASPCGLEAARPAVLEWQNQFDELIFVVAGESSIPAQVLKNIFSRESQFWPGVYKQGLADVGLGQLTPDGADTTLLWNYSFYRQFCPLILNGDLCASVPYSELSDAQQAMLRGALIRSVDATCEDCPLGIDISKANFSVSIFARTLLANCQQAGRVVQNVTKVAPGKNVTYEDMWRFTLVNYNAGTGCLHNAVQAAHGARLPLTWGNVQAFLEPGCRGAIQYVDDVTR